ncbi:heat shock 70 kDa protein 16-like [Aegilops tauschii subsp. strangulata]|uniref:heat shock 70 kDa protein 16-like n=1 Tax=Aegilops tauschii subsp. strangulata TaxID=200361 RepID=UPI003CC8C454
MRCRTQFSRRTIIVLSIIAEDHKSRNERPMQRQDLQVDESIYGEMGKQELLEAQEKEQLAYQDKLVMRTKERKNALESYVYDTRNKLSERYQIFATDSEREEISVNLQQTEEWLYEEGDDETEAVYTSKLEELKKMLEPRSKTPPSTTTPTTPEVPTTTCRPLTTTRSSLGGSQAGGLCLFRSISQFVLAFLRQTCLTYVCTQILLLPLTRL